MQPVRIDNFRWWLNTSDSWNLKDNQMSIAKNMYYNDAKQLGTRRGYRTFGDSIGNSPITSYFFFQKDDGTGQTALCSSGTVMYKYDGVSAWTSIKTGLHEYELITGYTANRTRRDYAVYKNIIYMCNGVDQYASYDGTTYSQGTTVPVVCTFDNTTDIVLKVAHWLSNGAEVAFTTTGALPTWLSISEVYFVVNKTADNFQISLTKSWTAINFTTNGTGTNSYYPIPTPRVRYVSQLTDRMFAGGDDNNPNNLYYSNAQPADWFAVDTNFVIVWWDENGKINAIGELWQVILAFKSSKIYSVNVTSQSALPLDAQSWWYSDRSVNNVWNSIVFFNEQGIDTLKQRQSATWAQALESQPLSEDLWTLLSLVEEKYYNSWVWLYIKKYNNYYFSFDTNGDDIPDTTLVYNSLVGAFTQYERPNHYDLWFYIATDLSYQYLLASAGSWQMFEIEYWFDDNWVSIEHEVQTKNFDFETPWFIKTFEYVDIVWQLSLGTTIVVQAIVDGEVVWWWNITDANANVTTSSSSLWVTPIGTQWLTWPTSTTDIDLYRFSVRVPLYQSGTYIAINLSSTWWQWIVERIRIWIQWEPIDVYASWSIL